MWKLETGLSTLRVENMSSIMGLVVNAIGMGHVTTQPLWCIPMHLELLCRRKLILLSLSIVSVGHLYVIDQLHNKDVVRKIYSLQQIITKKNDPTIEK